MNELMEPGEFLRLGMPLLDVRAPVEFAEGHLPGANIPILDDEQRHQVGVTYKKEGPDAAVALGHTLVDPHRERLTEAWIQFLKAQKIPILTCFRGGQRSRIAQEWLKAAGFPAVRIKGGYKALRANLLAQLEKPIEGYALTGWTGSAKTSFLRALCSPQVIDLEGLANHRGSAFGGLHLPPQPAQQTFENDLSLKLMKAGPYLFEAESRLIGKRVLPEAFFSQLSQLPRIFMEVPQEIRAQHIYKEYVQDPLQYRNQKEVMVDLENSLLSIRNRLGGLEYQNTLDMMRIAFLAKGSHLDWITNLLTIYYDKLYEHSIKRTGQKIVFRGPPEACRQWLKDANFFVGNGTDTR